MIAKTEKKLTTRVPCSKCGGRVFKVEIDQEVFENIQRYPFPIILMHSSTSEKERREVHTLIAYIDKDLQARHVTILDGKRVFITPYILYNPNLIAFSCNKSLGGR